MPVAVLPFKSQAIHLPEGIQDAAASQASTQRVIRVWHNVNVSCALLIIDKIFPRFGRAGHFPTKAPLIGFSHCARPKQYVPKSPEEVVEQALGAIRRAFQAGIRRQQVELLLPLIGATDLDDWCAFAESAFPSCMHPSVPLHAAQSHAIVAGPAAFGSSSRLPCQWWRAWC